jgi:hypothetical protein
MDNVRAGIGMGRKMGLVEGESEEMGRDRGGVEGAVERRRVEKGGIKTGEG